MMDADALNRIATALERIAEVIEFKRDLEVAQRKAAQIVRMEDIAKRRTEDARR